MVERPPPWALDLSLVETSQRMSFRQGVHYNRQSNTTRRRVEKRKRRLRRRALEIHRRSNLGVVESYNRLAVPYGALGLVLGLGLRHFGLSYDNVRLQFVHKDDATYSSSWSCARPAATSTSCDGDTTSEARPATQ